MSDVDFTKADGEGLSRQQSWPVEGPVELDLGVDLGRIRVQLEPRDGTQEVRVEVRHDPSAGGMVGQGISGLMSWLGGATGGGIPDAAQLAAEAVRAAEISFAPDPPRLLVRSAQELPLRAVPLAVTVSAPAGSRLSARAGSGDVRVAGTAGRASVRTGSGQVTVSAVDGDADITTGSGDVEVGPVTGRARVRTGSGAVSVAETGGPAEIRASSGDVQVGAVAADLGVRTGSGEVRIGDACAGRIELTTGSGELHVGVHPGVLAELDLTSGSGRTRSDLDVRREAPSEAPRLVITGRTGSGDVLVTRAAAASA